MVRVLELTHPLPTQPLVEWAKLGISLSTIA